MRTGVLALAVLFIVCVIAAAAVIRKLPPMPTKPAFTLASSAFSNNGTIPANYTCDGVRKLSPPLSISGVPEGTKSLVLVMDDPDIPNVVRESRGIDTFDHWVLYDIPADTAEIPEDAAFLGVAGLNSAGTGGYTGPCPPPDYEPSEHRYIFTLYALSAPTMLPPGATKKEVLEALGPLLIAKTELVGRYSRK